MVFCDMGRTDFRPEYQGGLRCELRDQAKKLVPSESFPFGGAVPLSEWLSVSCDGMIRVRATPFGIYRPGDMALASDVSTRWVISIADNRAYSLSGTFTVNPSPEAAASVKGHVWRGTIALQPVKIVNQRK